MGGEPSAKRFGRAEGHCQTGNGVFTTGWFTGSSQESFQLYCSASGACSRYGGNRAKPVMLPVGLLRGHRPKQAFRAGRKRPVGVVVVVCGEYRSCFRLLAHSAGPRPHALSAPRGSNNPIKTAITATITSNSIRCERAERSEPTERAYGAPLRRNRVWVTRVGRVARVRVATKVICRLKQNRVAGAEALRRPGLERLRRHRGTPPCHHFHTSNGPGVATGSARWAVSTRPKPYGAISS